MTLKNRWQCLAVAGLGLGLAVATTGCQTYFGGMTLPSPWYLQHRPQYFAPDPDFPLQHELSTMQAQAAAANAANARVAEPLPPAVAVPAPAAPPPPAVGVPPPPPAPIPGGAPVQ
jgi:hypothetical protein